MHFTNYFRMVSLLSCVCFFFSFIFIFLFSFYFFSHLISNTSAFFFLMYLFRFFSHSLSDQRLKYHLAVWIEWAAMNEKYWCLTVFVKSARNVNVTFTNTITHQYSSLVSFLSFDNDRWHCPQSISLWIFQILQIYSR